MFVTVDGIANITDIFDFTGKSASFVAEIIQVWRNDVNDATFTYSLSNKTISIPNAVSGNKIKVKFRLYLVANTSGAIAPKDPTDSLSADRFWEPRLARAPTITRSMDQLERGYATTVASDLTIALGDSWQQLAQLPISFEWQQVYIYKATTLVLKAQTMSQRLSESGFSLNIQKPNTALDQLATFGDPDYLVTVDPSHSSSYYTGSNIPDLYYGQAIPMIFGTSTPYTREGQGSADSGTVIGTPLVPPLVGPIAFQGINSIIKPIPITNKVMIIGKIPSYQSLASNTQVYTPTTVVRLLTKIQSYTAIPNYFIGQAVNLSKTSGSPLATDLGLVLNQNDAYTTKERTSGTFIYDTITINLNIKVINVNPTKTIGAFPTVSVSEITPGGHRLVKLTFDAATTDIRVDTPLIVIDNMTGAKSGAGVLQYILESHGLTVNSSQFTTVSARVPEVINLISGIDKNIPKLSDLVTEINGSVFGSIYPDATTDTQKYVYYGEQTPSETLTSAQIKDLEVESDARDIANSIKFKSKYITQEDLQSAVNTIKTNTNATTVLGASNQLEREHLFESTPSRLTDIMTHCGNSQQKVTFLLLDDTVSIDLGDNVTIDHYRFQGGIFITEIQTLDLGRRITGRVFNI